MKTVVIERAGKFTLLIVMYLVECPRIKAIHRSVCVYIQEVQRLCVTETPSISAK